MINRIALIIILTITLYSHAFSQTYSRESILNYDILGLKLGVKATVAHEQLLQKGFVINNGNPPDLCELEFCLATSYSYNKDKNHIEIFTSPSMKGEPILITRIKYLPHLLIGKFINNEKVSAEGFEELINEALKNLRRNIIAKYGEAILDSSLQSADYLGGETIFELYYIDENITNLLELHKFKTNLYSDLKDTGNNICYVGQLRNKGLQEEHRKTHCNTDFHNNHDTVLTAEYDKMLNNPYLAVILYNYTNENPILFELGFNDLNRHQTQKIKNFLKNKEKMHIEKRILDAIDFEIEF